MSERRKRITISKKVNFYMLPLLTVRIAGRDFGWSVNERILFLDMLVLKKFDFQKLFPSKV